MRATVAKLRAQLEAFDAAEVRTRVTHAQLRIGLEAELPSVCELYDIDEETGVRLAAEAAELANDPQEASFVLRGIAATWAGESTAWEEAVARVRSRMSEPAVRLTDVLEKVGSAFGQAVLSSGPR